MSFLNCLAGGALVQCDLVPVTLHDVSTYFSMDEWKLLHEWQKELYKSVITEIHQALISLGPLIVTTVFSLRAKEKEYSCSVTDSKTSDISNHSSGAVIANSSMTFRKHAEETQYMAIPPDSDRKESKNNHNTGFFTAIHPDILSPLQEDKQLNFRDWATSEDPEISNHPTKGYIRSTDMCLKKEHESKAVLMEHPYDEGKRTINRSAGHDVISFIIKEEEEMSFLENEGMKNIGDISSPRAGDWCMKRKRKVGELLKCNKQKAACKATAQKSETNVLHGSERSANSGNQMWSECYQEQGGGKTTHSDNRSSYSQHFILHHERSKEEISFEVESDHDSSQLPSVVQNKQQNTYACTKCDKSFSIKEDLVRHVESHSRTRPFTCRDCGKSFLQKGNLIKHYRTHTGEKPYQCIFCHKSFSRKDYLNGHMRIHTGERPYKCPECEKCFTQKGEFNQHRRKHI
ncbi:zinc finger protein 551-like isoform X2 [Pleurodeles waltl]|uniref:zinc finger protein 551-like isoform X2 n=1 Tax=Pleurodeles waltl TaxID=8319 RepID=UPI0037096426